MDRVRELCANCIADLMNASPDDFEVYDQAGQWVKWQTVDRPAALEEYAQGKPTLKFRHRRSGRFILIVAVTTIQGVPCCSLCSADRHWNMPAGVRPQRGW